MLAALTFQFQKLRLRFRAIDNLYLLPYQTGNTLRGIFGYASRKLACSTECPGARTCNARQTCLYAQIFEPRAAAGEGPSGLSDWPRPFVFRAAHLDGQSVQTGEEFHFDIHLLIPALRSPIILLPRLTVCGVPPSSANPGR